MSPPPPLPTSAPSSGSGSGGAPAPREEFPFLSRPREAGDLGSLGEFRVIRVLGRGGMGFVFEAFQPVLRRKIALKVMRPEVARRPGALGRFTAEAQAAAQVEHDHIVPVYHVGEEGGVPFIAMPLLRGLALGVALKSTHRPPSGEVLRVGGEVADGLMAAHAQGLIHRDIKPANIWLEGDKRRVRILDFGLAEEFVPDAAPGGGPPAGPVVGTPAYMSPEQWSGRAGAPADLWSLGVVLYEMLTGVRPFDAPSGHAICGRVLGFTPDPPAALNPNCPPDLNVLVMELLQKDPAARPTAAAVRHRLDTIRAALSAGATTAVADDPWAGIGAPESESVATARLEGTIAERRPRAAVTPWAWAVGAVLVAGTVVGAGVAHALLAGRQPQPNEAAATDPPPPPRKPPTSQAKTPPPTPTPPAIPPNDPARAVAKLVLDHNGAIDTPGEKNLRALPDRPFELHAVRLLQSAKMTDDLAAQLGNLESLEILELRSRQTTAGHLASLSTAPLAGRVKTLTLSGSLLTKSGGEAVARFANVTSLTVSGPGGAHRDGVAALTGLKRLTELKLNRGAATYENLIPIPLLTGLTKLSLDGSDQVTDSGLVKLEGCESLTELDLKGTAVTAEGVARLKAHFGARCRIVWVAAKGPKNGARPTP